MKILTNGKEAKLEKKAATIQVDIMSLSVIVENLLEYMQVPESEKDSVERSLRDFRHYGEEIDSLASALLREV